MPKIVQLWKVKPLFSIVSTKLWYVSQIFTSSSLFLSLFFFSPLSHFIVSTRNEPWFTKVRVYDNIVIAVHVARRYQQLVNVTSACYFFRRVNPEYVSPIDYIRLTLSKIIISVLVRAQRACTRLIVIGRGSDICVRDFDARWRQYTYAINSWC